jgi:hypothetical protein
MQASLAMVTTLEKKLIQTSALLAITDEVHPQSGIIERGQVAEHHKDLNTEKVTTPCQISAEDESLPETRENSSEFTAFTLGFLGHMATKANPDGIYNSPDGIEDEETGQSWDYPAEASHRDQEDGPSNVDVLKLVNDLVGQTCQDTTSPRKRSPPKRPVHPAPVTVLSARAGVQDDSKYQASASPRKRLAPQRWISLTPIDPPAATSGILDDLCSLMDKTSLDISDQQLAKRIKIPKAYKFSISTQPKCHYDSTAFFKAGTNNRRVAGEKRKREDLCFKPQEVIKKGALCAPELDVKSTLIGDIHPIFNEKHWTGCPHHVYEIIKPALLLVSKLLTTPQCLQHFQIVLKGKRNYCVETSFRKQKDCYRICNDDLLTTESVEDLKSYIESMAGSITF